MDCTRFQELLPRYLAEELPEDGRAAWREHLLACSSCRVTALEREPSLLFALAARRENDGARAQACADSVVASIRRERLERRIRPRRRPWLAAAAAAVVAIGGGLAFHQMERQDPAAPRTAAAVQTREAAPEVDIENEGENVRVYQLAADENTNVTFVVDPSLEL